MSGGLQADRRAAWRSRLLRAPERWPTAVNPQELEVLARKLGRFAPEERFDLLAEAFTGAESYLLQQYAGLILDRTNPPCQHPLGEVLRRVLPQWNRSVEQLPRYLAAAFGRDGLLAGLAEVERSGAVDRAKTNAVRYWLRGRQRTRGDTEGWTF